MRRGASHVPRLSSQTSNGVDRSLGWRTPVECELAAFAR